jgi:3-oxoacyl-ACP reductase-like protein
MIWKIWIKCEMIGNIWKKSKLNSEKIREIQKKPVSRAAAAAIYPRTAAATAIYPRTAPAAAAAIYPKAAAAATTTTAAAAAATRLLENPVEATTIVQNFVLLLVENVV